MPEFSEKTVSYSARSKGVGLSSRRRLWISAFIVFHWTAGVLTVGPVWHWGVKGMPLAERVWTNVQRGALAYMNLVSHAQVWNMFVGNKSDMSKHTRGVIHFTDGSQRVHEFRRFGELGYVEAQRWHRHRRLHRALAKEKTVLWTGLARWLARRYDDAANPPRQVDLVVVSVLLPELGSERYRRLSSQGWVDYTRILRLEPEVRVDTLWRYAVRPEDL